VQNIELLSVTMAGIYELDVPLPTPRVIDNTNNICWSIVESLERQLEAEKQRNIDLQSRVLSLERQLETAKPERIQKVSQLPQAVPLPSRLMTGHRDVLDNTRNISKLETLERQLEAKKQAHNDLNEQKYSHLTRTTFDTYSDDSNGPNPNPNTTLA
jgi:hypothetical protein